MRKGDGKNPLGTRWLMQSGVFVTSLWVTRGLYTEQEVDCWECSFPVRPLYPLDVLL